MQVHGSRCRYACGMARFFKDSSHGHVCGQNISSVWFVARQLSLECVETWTPTTSCFKLAFNKIVYLNQYTVSWAVSPQHKLISCSCFYGKYWTQNDVHKTTIKITTRCALRPIFSIDYKSRITSKLKRI